MCFDEEKDRNDDAKITKCNEMIKNRRLLTKTWASQRRDNRTGQGTSDTQHVVFHVVYLVRRRRKMLADFRTLSALIRTHP